MPAEETPIEEAFALKFTEQGGKFLYCEDKKESVNVFKNILAEMVGYWKCFVSDQTTRALYQAVYHPDKTNLNARFFLTDCEFLVADGSIIIVPSNCQSYWSLPENFMIVAGTKTTTDLW